jgi:uncharacterized protein (TIGR02646 family)
MRRIDRTALALPNWFSTAASDALDEARTLRGTRRLRSDDFNGQVYGHPEVKQELWKTQHRKCCWCEQKLSYRGHDVDHFRPKARAKRADGHFDEGYWWLAYDSDNLFFSCTYCNTRKSDNFPLVSGTAPLASGHHPSTGSEHPKFLHPAEEDPTAHLKFVEDAGRWRIAEKNASPRGLITLTEIALDRDELDELRDEWITDHLRPVRLRFEQASSDDQRKAAHQEATVLCQARMTFSLLARCYFVGNGVLTEAMLP